MQAFLRWFERFLRRSVVPPFRDKPWTVTFTTLDSVNLLTLTALSLLSRFHTFWFPSSVVFDEIHFGNFTNFYINHTHFFDVHPPLAKLIIAWFAHLSEYDGSIPFGRIFAQPYPDESFLSLRIPSVVFSSMVAPLLYLTVRLAGFSKIAAFTTGVMVTFETSMICEGRFILTDGMLHFFVALHLAVSMYWYSLGRNTREWKVWLYLTSLSLGFAISVKFTALSLCAILLVHELICLFFENSFKLDGVLYHDFCLHAAQLAIPALVFQGVLWVIHTSLLWYVGDDMPPSLNQTLINESVDDPNDWRKLLSPNIAVRVFETLFQIQGSNMINYKSHPYMSKPGDWPLLTDLAVLFWSQGDRWVLCIGNVFVYYIALLSVVMVLLGFKKRCYRRAFLFVIGYLTSYLPFFLVPRTVFLYHYIIPLMFACVCTGISLDFWMGPTFRGMISMLVCAIVVFGYTEWAPLVYGREMSRTEIESRTWNKVWLSGKVGRAEWMANYDAKFDRMRAQESAGINRLRKMGVTV
jgi:dolichyl-phosphate-mannose--protein O-mannosyl transferase